MLHMSLCWVARVLAPISESVAYTRHEWPPIPRLLITLTDCLMPETCAKTEKMGIGNNAIISF